MAKKHEVLQDWKELQDNQDPLEHMAPIPYKSTGSKYGACGIRIDGTPEFIDAVLSNLKTLINGENQVTRLELARSEVKPTTINGETKSFVNKSLNAEVCYVRLHIRGHEGAIVQGLMKQNKSATDTFEQTSKYARGE
jgi:hypothetical protein